MSLFANVSDLAHELRCATGTVLTILGSKLEADERARVDASALCAGCGHARADHYRGGPCGHRVSPSMAPCGCRGFLESVGPQWLSEFEEQRDSLEPADMCQFHGEWCAGEASWCTRQCSKCDEAVYWHRDVEAWFHCAGVLDRRPCPYGDGPVVEHSSAAVSAAADPSPARPSPSPASAGGEGSGGDSDILPSPPPERPQCGAQYWCRDLYTCSRPLGHDGDHGYAGSWAKGVGPDRGTCVRCGRPLGESALAADQGGYWCSVACQQLDQDSCPVPLVVAGESPREEEEQPSLGAAVTHEDLAAHLIGAAIQANTGHVDVLVEAFASSLLADFNITRREAAGE